MSDEIQVQSPTDLQVQGSPTFKQQGNWNTQIGYIGQQINYIKGGGMPQIFKPANPNYEYYNLFVIDQGQLDSLVAIPRNHSLNDYTAAENRKIYALPGLAAAEKIKRMPALFVIRNKYGNRTTEEQHAAYGYIVDITEKSNTIIVTASISHLIRQEKLNCLEDELQLLRAPENNELDDVHWAIKKVNLP